MPRAQKVDPNRLTQLEQRLAKAKRDLARELAKGKDQARRDDARRKIIAGALALEHSELHPDSEFGQTMRMLLREHVRADDRHLFEFLSPQEAPAPEPIAEVAE